MPFDLSIPTARGPSPVSFAQGSSTIFVGANGGGKTRLAEYIEKHFGESAHRIAAHRALALNPAVAKVSERQALAGLRYGYAGENSTIDAREGNRWNSKGAVWLLNDFDFLLQALFAEHNNCAVETRQQAQTGTLGELGSTKFEELRDIWQRLLPDRVLIQTSDDLRVSVPGGVVGGYSAAEMSDGERAVFYIVGQVLLAKKDSLLLFDEPELHVHRSILAKLWDELEAARKDCAFVLITHDLEFAASRPSKKYVIRDFDPAPCWTFELVPEDSGFDEDIATLILGSRRPVLFVEGKRNGLDVVIYRCCFPEWTVIARGSCEEVIHSVGTMRKNPQLTRVTCAGIVDADGRGAMKLPISARSASQCLPFRRLKTFCSCRPSAAKSPRPRATKIPKSMH